MSRFPNRPLVMAWAFRDLNRRVGWVFGFILAPEPPERQVPGGMCRALVNMEVWVQFRRWPWVVVNAYCADPGGPRDRPVRIPDAYSVHDRGYDFALGCHLRVLLDGKPVDSSIAYDRRAGWVDAYRHPLEVGRDGSLAQDRLRGQVEVQWIRDKELG